MPRRSVPLRPGSLQSREQLLTLGMSTRRLRGGDLTRVLPNHYTPTAAPASLNDLCHLLQGTIIHDAIISHSTAAALLGMPLPWWFDGGIGTLHEHGKHRDGVWVVPSSVPADKGRDGTSQTPTTFWQPPPLHCSVPRDARRTAGPHAVVHRGRPGDWVLHHGGLILAHPIDVVCQLAAALDLDELVILLDHLIGPSSPIPGTTASDIDAFLLERPSSRGRPAVGDALRLARPHVESPGETRLRLLLVRAGFPEPVPNHTVGDPDSPGRTRRIDDAYPGLLIGAEYQGDIHRTDKARWRDDEARRDALSSVGWNIRTATAQDIERPARFLAGMRRAFLAAGAPAPPAENWAGRNEARLGRRCAPPRTQRPGEP
ncbi:hypothetical protein [Brachybacterium sp. ACRRE]|uniref:hypothetical protein n=1 Tax=Brachybacterium sp. ACRRE TaxID=2918184 RepID=UPI001EF185AA|nr:hypothetical protein [Brachybacterium sp. ACRRE]MCG7310781.1 hypothetical protein [Brachybacterium sp. ACRRE]